MEKNYSIRNAKPTDADTIFRFISHLEEQSFDPLSFKERYADKLQNSDVFYLVAAGEQDEPIGFLSCHGQSLLHHEGEVFEIQEMYVAKNYRGRGIGKALFQALIENLSKTEAETLEVTTNANRSDARKFYTKLGFVQTHIKFVRQM
jgi:(aminoalkyl)phosphonate N-acetyltransferase